MRAGNNRVLTVTTNPAMDIALTVEALVPDHKLRARGVRREPGGGGVNVARVLARLGVGADALVAVGGAVGDELVQLLEAEGIGTVAFRVDGRTRESMAITDASVERQYRIVVDGPVIDDEAKLNTTVVEAAEDVDYVVVSGSLAPGLPVDFYRSVCSELSAVPTIVDCSGPALDEAISGAAFLVKPSRRELASLLTWTPATDHEIEIGARHVLDRGLVENLVVSLGPTGAVLVPRRGAAVWFAPPSVEVVSTVGAGDAMVAGIAAGLVDDLDIVAAVRRGVAAGTATASTPGTALCDAASVRVLEDRVAVSSVPRG